MGLALYVRFAWRERKGQREKRPFNHVGRKKMKNERKREDRKREEEKIKEENKIKENGRRVGFFNFSLIVYTLFVWMSDKNIGLINLILKVGLFNLVF